MTPDRELVHRIVFGRPAEQNAAWSELRKRFYQALVAAARRAVGREAEDCVEEFLQTRCSRNRLAAYLRYPPEKSPPLRAYLIRAVRNFARKEYIRGRGWHHESVSYEPSREDARRGRPIGCGLLPPDPAEAAVRKETLQRVQQELAKLGPMDRVCFVLRYLEELELSEADWRWLEQTCGRDRQAIQAYLADNGRRLGRAIAQLLGLSEAAYYKRIERVRKRLAHLAGEGG